MKSKKHREAPDPKEEADIMRVVTLRFRAETGDLLTLAEASEVHDDLVEILRWHDPEADTCLLTTRDLRMREVLYELAASDEGPDPDLPAEEAAKIRFLIRRLRATLAAGGTAQ